MRSLTLEMSWAAGHTETDFYDGVHMTLMLLVLPGEDEPHPCISSFEREIDQRALAFAVAMYCSDSTM
jgi:hypothetical protein